MGIDSIGIAPINTPKIDVQVINAPTIRHPVVPISVPIGFPVIEMPCVDDKKNEEIFFVECPGPKDQRVGDFRNEKRLERVKGHELRNDGRECITLYEPVTFVEQYLPSGATASFTAATALVAASTPLLLNIIKPAVKNIVKKITSRKKKEDK
jgi:hypothetical protein